MFIDVFSAGLDDMPRRKQRSTYHVLDFLSRIEQYSIFEATENEIIAETMDRLIRMGLIECDNSCGYPWIAVKVTAKGSEYLKRKRGES